MWDVYCPDLRRCTVSAALRLYAARSLTYASYSPASTDGPASLSYATSDFKQQLPSIPRESAQRKSLFNVLVCKRQIGPALALLMVTINNGILQITKSLHLYH